MFKRDRIDDVIDEASMESFPASDAPAWATGQARKASTSTNVGSPMDDSSPIRLRRAYETPTPADGRRILVDRLWPRGVSKGAIHIDTWAKDVGPSTELRKWFGHDPAKWTEFERRYREELAANSSALTLVLEAARSGTVTLVYGARDEQHNEAVVLKAVLDDMLRQDRTNPSTALP